MTVIHAAARERLGPGNRPNDCPASSAGMFVIRTDGTARFDRHFHDFDEFWFVAAGSGTITLDDIEHLVEPGDIIHTRAGMEHDIVAVSQELKIFWLSGPLPPGSTGTHLHRSPVDAAKHAVLIPAHAEGA